jgi:hypothetical protein
MNIEQIAREVVLNMNQPGKLASYLTADAMCSGGILPQPLPATEAVKVTEGLVKAMPDLTFKIESVTVNGDKATVNVVWSGTQTGPLDLGIPEMPALPPSGKKATVNDGYILTFRGDKVSHFFVLSPADGGIPAALAQLGVHMPVM